MVILLVPPSAVDSNDTEKDDASTIPLTCNVTLNAVPETIIGLLPSGSATRAILPLGMGTVGVTAKFGLINFQTSAFVEIPVGSNS